MLRFAYSLSALQKLILQLKNVEYEQKHFQGVVLPQAQRAEKERNDSRDVPHHGERKYDLSVLAGFVRATENVRDVPNHICLVLDLARHGNTS